LRVFAVALIALFFSAPARADKLIWIPTADVRAAHGEFMAGRDRGRDVVTAQVGLGQYFELLGRRVRTPRGSATEVGGQMQILPEGFITPGLALGVWDVANETARGRRGFLVVSKELPGVSFLPTVLRGVRVHGGLGTGDLSGIFLGANLRLPLGLALVAETHRGDFNAGLWWTPLRAVSVKAESWNGDFFFGARVSAPL
jgi:hypothetical protein